MDDDKARQAIAERNHGFERLFAQGDARALVDYYFVSDDLSPMASPPGGVPPVSGRAALVALFDSMLADGGTIALETLELTIVAETAYEFGRARLMSPNDDPAFGRYMVIWRFDGSEWRAKLDFFAADGWPD